MNRVIPRIFGGLGNQLFIYAAARRLALINHAELVLDDVSGFAYDTNYQRRYQLKHFNIQCRTANAEERMQPFPRVRRYFLRWLNERRPFTQRKYLVQEGIDFDRRLLDFKVQDVVYIEGYWQGEGYFKDVEAAIRQDLHITPPTDSVNLAMKEKILSCMSVAVHFRFFDKPSTTGIYNLAAEYYTRAFNIMEQLNSDAHYFIFSDEIEATRSLPLPNGHVTIVSHNKGDENAYADLWLMTHCKHFIIANSTFSWWGAWLATNPAKLVIAPGHQVLEGTAAWGFKGLIPDMWIKL